MPITFKELNLHPALLEATTALGFEFATPVQEEVIPAAILGGDLMVSSQTGSGKTAAFLLPLIHQLLTANPNGKPVPGRAEPHILVLCPTRELAQQVAADAIEIVKFARGIRIATIMGGMPYGKQIASLKGAQIVVATPGRLIDLNDSRAIRLDKVNHLVVDEADRMLDLGFAEDLENIHRRCENLAQTMMFSATFAPRIMELAHELVNDPTRIELAHAGDVHTNITQTMHWADSMSHKHKILRHWLSDPTLDQAVVFASTQIESEDIADNLRADGYAASALHGAMPQAVRNRRLDSLRKGVTKILVATDVAARGIDVPTISHVINFGLPMKPEDYTHRIGRTGRAGRSGIAITIALHSERVKIRGIERFTQNTLAPSIIPGLEPQKKAESGPRPGGRSGGGGGRSDRSGGGGRSDRSGGGGGGRGRAPSRSNSSNSFSNNESRNSFASDRPRPAADASDRPRRPVEANDRPRPPADAGHTSSEPKDNKYGKGQRSDARRTGPKTESFSKSPTKPFGDFPAKPKAHANASEQRFTKPRGEGFAGRDKAAKPFNKTGFKPR
jgi:superfamily II DNA/RNA helicase